MSKNKGYCHCCRSQTFFEELGPWLRDQYVCLTCNSIPRQRHLNYIMDSEIPNWENLLIHESSPSNDFIKRHSNYYSHSQFFPEIKLGDQKNGIRSENLERLTYPNSTFDIFITQDVLEHVFNPDIAVKEIMRVLKTGGIHIFTAPKNNLIKKSYPRAKLVKDNVIDYLCDKQYHGSPIGDGQSLVTWDYGKDFEQLLNQWSRCSTVTYVTRDRELGIDGEYLEVFLTTKNIL